nr:MAG TPA: YtxH-like protein [Herelleviridae sp.]
MFNIISFIIGDIIGTAIGFLFIYTFANFLGKKR